MGDDVPADGILVYYVNESIPAGQGPVRVFDAGPETDLVDPLRLGDVTTALPSVYPISVANLEATPDGFRVAVHGVEGPWVDVGLRTGVPAHTSPDIWIENTGDDGEYAEPPIPGWEQPELDRPNRIYARIHNLSPGDATGTATFSLSAPFHTTGGTSSPAFSPRWEPVPFTVAADGYVDVWVPWTPTAADGEHACVQVAVDVTGDVDETNDVAQQNLKVQETMHGSPYSPVTLDFDITPGVGAGLLYQRQDGIPPAWPKTLVPTKVYAASGGLLGHLEVQPAITAPECSQHDIHVTSWTPGGDTLVRVGGTTLVAQLKERTEIVWSVTSLACGPLELAALAGQLGHPVDSGPARA
jgi:hypothetical protein